MCRIWGWTRWRSVKSHWGSRVSKLATGTGDEDTLEMPPHDARAVSNASDAFR